jgi:hypothetical protein
MNYKKSINNLFFFQGDFLRAAFFAVVAMAMIGCAPTVTVRTAPPAIPFYEQPFCPGPGYLWVPGYWAYGSNGYYWVPGIWERAPHVGWMWTPGYWGWYGGAYVWHGGYWGRHIGFYGGINYGYGYSGVGYTGGYWRENEFYYNNAVTRVNVTIVKNTYAAATTAPAAATAGLNKDAAGTVSYNGGGSGVNSKPTQEELAAAREQHLNATPLQKQHIKGAAKNPELLASSNHGQPRPEVIAKHQALAKVKAKNPNKKQKPGKSPKDQRQEQPRRGDWER